MLLYMYMYIITRMVDALMVTVSRHVIRVENTVTTSNLEALEVDLNDTRLYMYE